MKSPSTEMGAFMGETVWGRRERGGVAFDLDSGVCGASQTCKRRCQVGGEHRRRVQERSLSGGQKVDIDER